MKNPILTLCFCLLATSFALSQGNCGTAAMVLTGSTYTCTGTGQPQDLAYAATGSFTYLDTCYSSTGAAYGAASNTVAGTGQCAQIPGLSGMSNCPPANSTNIVYATTQSGLNAMYNYAYNTTISWPPGGGSFSCPKTGGFSQNVTYCSATWCLTGGGGNGFGGTGCCGGGEMCGAVTRRGGAQGEAGGGTICDPSTCGCEPASPIIIDTTGHGFHLTSPQEGVYFDILNTGIPVKIAWTSATSGNALLALDRNHYGRIDDGGELFGDHTQQPPSDNPNGYLALAEFDKPENGGNGDGIIDWHDAVYSKLLLWIDENHDGISQPNELHTLPELGVYSIALHYQEEPYTDDWGNWFHYRAAVNPSPVDGQSKDGRWTYDVFFMPEKTSLPAKAAAFKLTEPPLFK